jgi:hypothetical protein
MSKGLTRREVIAGGLAAAAAAMAAGRGPGAIGAETAVSPPAMPDRSADAPTSPVAIARCESYEPQLVRKQLAAAIDLSGGIGPLLKGKTVTVKLNLTGGGGPMNGLPAYQTYQVHPHAVAALCALLAEAGAKQICVVESCYFREPPEKALKALGWDVDAILAAGDRRVAIENTRNRGQWPAYSRLKVPWGGFLYPAFDVNSRYEKTDVFISLAKLKDHNNGGITVAAKNMFGMPPLSLYGGEAPSEDTLTARMEIFHDRSRAVPAGVPAEVGRALPAGRPVWQYRVPRIIADCVGARPIDLAVIDGVQTVTGGEGPWIEGLRPASPKLLLVGRNPVCTDAVCAAVMGYRPDAAHFEYPFQGENHLRLLAQAGVGTCDLKRIETRGLPVSEAKFPFRSPAAHACGAPYRWVDAPLA